MINYLKLLFKNQWSGMMNDKFTVRIANFLRAPKLICVSVLYVIVHADDTRAQMSARSPCQSTV